MKRPSNSTILLVVTVATVTILVTSIAAMWLSRIANLRVPTLGTITTLGVEAYWDVGLTNQTQSIEWGTIYPGSSQNVTIFIRSTSNVETTLIVNATDWNPTNLSDYMDLTWFYNGTTILPEEVIQVTLHLSASSSDLFIAYLITNDIKQFSFDIVIKTQEHR